MAELVGALDEGGFTRLDKHMNKFVFGRFQAQKATFGLWDTYVDLQGIEEHLTDCQKMGL